MWCPVIRHATSTARATPWGRPTGTGEGPRSEGGSGCSFGTTRRPRSSCTPGSMMSRPCGLRGASQIPMPCSRKCSDVEIRQTIGTYRSEEHTSELQSLMRISYAVFCLKKKKQIYYNKQSYIHIEMETPTDTQRKKISSMTME